MNDYVCSELEGVQSLYSDFYKDVHGVRPRFMSDEQWNSIAWLEAQIDQLNVDAVRVQAEEDARVEADIADFEVLVAKTIEHGAFNRETAIRWIAHDYGCDHDMRFLCFLHGLPYDYFVKNQHQLGE